MISLSETKCKRVSCAINKGISDILKIKVLRMEENFKPLTENNSSANTYATE